MAKKNIEESVDFQLDTTIEETTQYIPVVPKDTTSKIKEKVSVETSQEDMVNCLRDERVIVRHIDKQYGGITNPKHVLYGGMSVNAIRKFSVPRLSSGTYVNVLTNNEKNCLEEALGLEKNALSVHLRTNNFWDDSNGNGIS